ncbi:DUF481 domain-containing protein [Mucilaginibacter aquatilis]|uniref:DUF481 domain-containing protein n=1 Tax=Mucilaginibacter aquatilis TaxID=1517760 RepID=A0A6I4ID56_9SPHI|nr:DUF481 domain-containing protein [Mucilaginibacter aquatilis]MVN93131.1 DUF481 domain-containing protein [Mucilaginibacter aquatilis]
MQRSLILCLLMLVLATITAKAQFNDTTNYHLIFNGSGTANRAPEGNTYLLNNALRFEVKKKSVSLNATNSWVYGKSNGSVTNNDYSAAIDFNLYKAIPHAYYWGLANYNTSFSLKINNQLLAGAGIAYSILDRPNAYLNVSDGILYDLSDINTSDTTREVYNTYRNSLRLQFHFVIKDLITIDSGNFWQPSLLRSNDHIIRTTFGLGFKVTNWLALNSSFAYNKITRTKAENTLLTYGLKLEKYF